MKFKFAPLIFILALATTAMAADPARYTELVQRAKGELSRKNPEGALKYADEAIRIFPAHWEAYVVATSAYTRLKRFDEAHQVEQLGIERMPEKRRPGLRKVLDAIIARGEGQKPTRLPANN